MDKIKQFSFAKCTKMESPYKGDNRLVYHLFVNVKSIPEGLPTEVNPREVNSKKIVYKKIVSGLTSNEDSFFVNNRGILIVAKKVTIDSLNNIIKLDIGNGSDKDNSLYGVLDGGHTYHAIINNRNLIDDEFSEFVHLEIMTNVRNIDELSSARNTSVQVSDKAIAELADKFEFVKKDISNTPFAKKFLIEKMKINP
ncbi:AIPR family protein [Streptococcus iniae]